MSQSSRHPLPPELSNTVLPTKIQPISCIALRVVLHRSKLRESAAIVVVVVAVVVLMDVVIVICDRGVVGELLLSSSLDSFPSLPRRKKTRETRQQLRRATHILIRSRRLSLGVDCRDWARWVVVDYLKSTEATKLVRATTPNLRLCECG
jgi:hypothetical protein